MYIIRSALMHETIDALHRVSSRRHNEASILMSLLLNRLQTLHFSSKQIRLFLHLRFTPWLSVLRIRSHPAFRPLISVGQILPDVALFSIQHIIDGVTTASMVEVARGPRYY